MKLKKITNQILYFECPTLKELSTSFFRVQEFYESPIPTLKGQSFSVLDFILAQMSNSGKLTYFKDWAGFNFPSTTYYEWLSKNELVPSELELARLIEKNKPKRKPFYVIAGQTGDDQTIDHELAHAFYFLDSNYKSDIANLLSELDEELYEQLCMKLTKLGYGENVFDDEINAYLATSDKDYLEHTMGVKYKQHKKQIKAFRSLFKSIQEQHSC